MFCPKCGRENLNTHKFCKNCGTILPDFTRVLSNSQQFHFSNHPQSLVGQILDGKYHVEAKIGSGGMGDVYRAKRLLIDDLVAIKILHTHLSHDPLAAERFRREAQTAIKLQHRNIVRIYDIGIYQINNSPYILMELAEGFTLRQIMIHNNRLPLDFIVTIITQVCLALSEAHKINIVHRDIKPENIIANQTDTGWQVKILDFGIAKLYNQTENNLTQNGSAMGTPQYMSPEQCLGETLDGRSDIYSLGVVLYEMFCGVNPFKSASPSAVIINQVQNIPPRPSTINHNISPEIESVILRALSKKPDERYQTAGELANEMIKAATAFYALKDVSEVLQNAENTADEMELDASDKDEPIKKPTELL